MNKQLDIVGMGYCSIDHLCRLPEIPVDNKAEILDLLIQGGGPAATATVAAARLGARTSFLGVLGDDENGRKILDEFKREGVDVSGMVQRSGKSSASAYCWAEEKTGHRSIAWTKGGATPLSPDEVRHEIIASSSILHLDGHQTEAAICAARQARKNAVTVMLDGGTLRPGMEELMALSNVVITSEVFAKALSGDDIEKALRKILAYGPDWAVVTLGNKGSMGFDGKDFITQRTFKVDVVDTTGAGDVYHEPQSCRNHEFFLGRRRDEMPQTRRAQWNSKLQRCQTIH